jgi:hypothetical protein
MSKEQQNQNEAVEPVQNEPEVLVAEGEVVEPGAAEETEVSLIQQLEESRAEVDALKKELVELKPRNSEHSPPCRAGCGKGTQVWSGKICDRVAAGGG